MICNICDQIASLLPGETEYRQDYKSLVLGTVQDVVRKSSCTVHTQLLIDALKLNSSASDAESVEVTRSAVYGEVCFQFANGDHRNGSFAWQMLGIESEQDRVELVNNDWIDLDQIKGWKDRCTSEHGHRCSASNLPALDNVRPAWLVDCSSLQIVSGDNHKPYLAFSYVWGQAQQFKLTKVMLQDLQKLGALSAQAVTAMLPLGIRDVLSLTSLLGVQYIWIDCLCIAQDDEVLKQQEILKMAGVYNNALMTIVLASPLEVGIRGLFDLDSSRPRDLDQKTYLLNERCTLVQRLAIRTDVRTDQWSKRAWTFQEDLFSHRILEFQKDTVFWRCQRLEWFEDIKVTWEQSGSDLDLEYDTVDFESSRDTLGFRNPNIMALERILSRYGSRDLTFAEDAHTAFSSILTVLSPYFKGGFVSGLPAVNLDVALLWLPYNPMTLRAGEQYTGSMLPTWSWIAWQGGLSAPCWNKAFDCYFTTGAHLDTSERALSLVEWAISDADGRPIRAIPNEWLALRKRYTEEDATPPDGWTRHEFNRFVDLEPEDEDDNIFFGYDPDDEDSHWSISRPEYVRTDWSIPTRYYTHESAPKSRYWYPIPMPNPNETSPDPVVVPYITCNTLMSRLYGAERVNLGRQDHGAIALRDATGKFFGVLRPNQWHPHLTYGSPEGDRHKHNLTGSCFDLVELSLGYCYEDGWAKEPTDEDMREMAQDFYYETHGVGPPRSEPNIDEWRHPERPRKEFAERYVFYNLMWVVWRGGIAYRRGIGRAEKGLWESLTREKISLVLG